MIFIDASYLVALAVRADALHGVAADWSRRAKGPFLTTEYVLIEFMNGLSAPKLRFRAHQLLAAVTRNESIRIIPASDAAFRDGVTLHAARSDKSWSLTDCISFNVMRADNVRDALTHDRHFEQAG